MTRITVFDFDDTLIEFQSPNLFIEQCIEGKKIRLVIFKFLSLKIVKRFFRIIRLNHKKISTFLLIGLTEKYVSNCALIFYNKCILKNINRDVINIMKIRAQNEDIYIISGGFRYYIELFCNDFNIQHFEANEIINFKGRLMGLLKHSDCMGQEKVVRLKKYLDNDFGNVYLTTYSDCYSDMPLFRLSQNAFIVKKSIITKIK